MQFSIAKQKQKHSFWAGTCHKLRHYTYEKNLLYVLTEINGTCRYLWFILSVIAYHKKKLLLSKVNAIGKGRKISITEVFQ